MRASDLQHISCEIARGRQRGLAIRRVRNQEQR
jgi:hypothetical protein